MKTCDGWCGKCYANVRGRANYSGHQGYQRPRTRREFDLVSFLRKRRDAADGSGPVAVGDGLADGSPATYEFLSSPSFEDGSTRRTGTLLVFCESGSWKCCVTDRDCDAYAFVTARSFQELFEAVEMGLQDGSLDWRQRPAAGRKPAK